MANELKPIHDFIIKVACRYYDFKQDSLTGEVERPVLNPSYLERVKKAEEKLDVARNMTLVEAAKILETERMQYLQDKEKTKNETEQRRQHYEKVLEELRAWSSPTQKHYQLKIIAIEEAKRGIANYGTYHLTDDEPFHQLTPKEFIEEEIRQAEANLADAKAKLQMEEENILNKHRWLNELLDNLPQEKVEEMS